MRLEIDLTANQILIIDENTPGTAADDRVVKSIPLLSSGEVRVDTAPITNPLLNKPSTNYADAVYAQDATGHLSSSGTTVNGNKVWAARFRSDGSVVNSAGNPTSVTLYFWEPLTAGSANAKDPKQVKAVTLFGGSGALRYWKYDGSAFQPN